MLVYAFSVSDQSHDGGFAGSVSGVTPPDPAVRTGHTWQTWHRQDRRYGSDVGRIAPAGRAASPRRTLPAMETDGAAPGGLYPVGLRLAGRRVVVVGGGPMGWRRTTGLLAAGALVRLVSPSLSPALEPLARSGAVEWVSRRFEAADVQDAWYVVAATDDPDVNAAVAAAAERHRTFCVRTDAARQSSAWTPAVGRSGALTVAVHAAGDPRRAAGVRDAVVSGLRDGSVPDRAHRHATAGVVLVGGGPGDPGLITVRGRQALAQADVVIADRLAPQALLAELPADVLVIDAGKLPRGRAMAQEQINALLVEHARAGRRVVRLKGGDPFVFGRGVEEVEHCVAAGVAVEVVPGVTSAVAVPGLAGIPVTHRGLAQDFVVVSGHLAPGDPGSRVDWRAIARLTGTVVLLMAVEHAGVIAAALLANGRPAATPVAVLQDGASPDLRVLTCRLDGLGELVAAEQVVAPAVIVVGEVVRLMPTSTVPPTVT